MHLLKSLAVASAGALVLVLPTTASAKPIVHDHYEESFTDSFTDTECGDPITVAYAGEFSGQFMLKERKGSAPVPYLVDNYSGTETFTNVANDKTFTIRHQGIFKDVHVEL